MAFIQQIDSDTNFDRIRMEKNQTGIKIELAKDSNMEKNLKTYISEKIVSKEH